MGRRPCCAKEGLNRGTWTVMEDKILTEHIRVHGEGQWRNLPKRAGLKRCGKSCRLRWLNYLRPDIKRGNITDDEEELIIRLHKLLGNRWSLIAGRLPGRTDNEIKNYWNTKIGKKSPAAAAASSSGQSRRPNVSKKLNQLQKQPNPTSKLSTSSVIRTKARRCTKVVISNTNPELPEPQNSGGHRHPDKVGPNLDQIMDDFEMDQNFLSDFLNIDFGMLSSDQLLNNEGGGKGVHSDTGTPDSDESGFFSDDVLNEFTNFPSMTSLIDGDWLQN